MARTIVVALICLGAILLAWHYFGGGLPIAKNGEEVLRYVPRDAETTAVFSMKMLSREGKSYPQLKAVQDLFNDKIPLSEKNIESVVLAQLPAAGASGDLYNLKNKLIVVKHSDKKAYEHITRAYAQKKIIFREDNDKEFQSFKMLSVQTGLDGNSGLTIAFPTEDIICWGQEVDVKSALRGTSTSDKTFVKTVNNSSTAKKINGKEFDFALYCANPSGPSESSFMLSSANDNNTGNFSCLAGKYVSDKELYLVGEMRGQDVTPEKLFSRIARYATAKEANPLHTADINYNNNVWSFEVNVAAKDQDEVGHILTDAKVMKDMNPNSGNSMKKGDGEDSDKKVSDDGDSKSDKKKPDAKAEKVTGTPSGKVVQHVVKKGDTVYRISQKYYGTKSKWREITKANPELDPGKLRIGNVVVVPLP